MYRVLDGNDMYTSSTDKNGAYKEMIQGALYTMERNGFTFVQTISDMDSETLTGNLFIFHKEG